MPPRTLQVDRDGNKLDIVTDSGQHIRLDNESGFRTAKNLGINDDEFKGTVEVSDKKWDDLGRSSFR